MTLTIINIIKTKSLLTVIFFGISFFNSNGQVYEKFSTQAYEFEINYWLNLHHFLWMESFMNVKKDSSVVNIKLSPADKMILNEALLYYRENLAKRSPKSDNYMSEFKTWITTKGKYLEQIPHKFLQHIAVLKDVSEVYKTSFWPLHSGTCKKVIRDNLELIISTEERFVKQITKLTRQFWQFEKIKVDVTYYGMASD